GAAAMGARGGARVAAVEAARVSAAALAANAAPLEGQLHVVRAPVETYLKRCGRLSGATVIVDPPRTGLSREVVTRLARRRPRRIVYVSCDVATQARDLRALRSSGYRLGEVRAFDMLPNTPHVETVVALDRA
ncbi:MAG: class I SAM-dependent RNA methyltransferase, partial [Acidobacteria bacterium]|nr:class I SAM-dependent RNA methyltransferase [Acidobacteriota bacterium]